MCNKYKNLVNMSHNIMISVSDEIRKRIDLYNLRHSYSKLQISKICSDAIDKVLCDDEAFFGSPVVDTLSNKHVCGFCKSEFEAKGRNAVYCSNKYRVAACRERKKISDIQ